MKKPTREQYLLIAAYRMLEARQNGLSAVRYDGAIWGDYYLMDDIEATLGLEGFEWYDIIDPDNDEEMGYGEG